MENQILISKLIEDIQNKQSIFITGAAGVGKTTLLLSLQNQLNEMGVRVALTSTIGMNAINLGGVTIHKLMGINVQTNENYIYTMKSNFLFSAIKKRLAKFDVIAIDEVSMLRGDQFNLIDRVLKETSGNDLPYGGKTLILTGDFYQIPPVVYSYEKEQNQWLFTSNAWKNGNIKTYELKKIWRQNDDNFIELLNNVRIGKIDNKKTQDLINKCVNRKPLDDDTFFFARNDECDLYNEQKLNEIKNKLYVYQAEVHGKRKKENKLAIIRECIAKDTLLLKVGAHVITIINDPHEEYFNGSRGIITKIKDKKITVRILQTGKEVIIKPYTWRKVDVYDKEIARMKQIPLILSYALTIHKSQGMTLESAVIDCKNIFTCGQLYVAMSRVKDVNNLTLINFNESKIISCKEVNEFYKEVNPIEIE